MVAAKRFYNFISARKWSQINLPRLNEFVLQQSRRPGQRLPPAHAPVVPLYAVTLGADTVEVGLINAAFLLMAGIR